MLTPSATSGGRVGPLCRGSGANCNGDCSGSGTNRQRADAGFPFDPQVDKMLIMQRSGSSLIRALYYVTNCHGLTVMVCRRLGTPRRFGRGRALPQRAHHREPGGRGGYAAFLAGPYPPRRRQPPPRGRDPCRGHRSFAARRPRRSASALQHRRRRRARPHAQASEKTREAVLTVCGQCGSGALKGAWPAVRACSRRAQSTSAWSPRSPRSSTRTSADPGPRRRLLAGASTARRAPTSPPSAPRAPSPTAGEPPRAAAAPPARSRPPPPAAAHAWPPASVRGRDLRQHRQGVLGHGVRGVRRRQVRAGARQRCARARGSSLSPPGALQPKLYPADHYCPKGGLSAPVACQAGWTIGGAKGQSRCTHWSV